jgi:small neutral amino acid transporter SnatA (MarC family)
MKIFLVIGLVFSPLAAMCAFIITYGEYSHHYPTKKEPLKLAWEAAIFTFIVFMVFILGAGFFISNFIQ